LAINWFKYSAPTTFYGLAGKLIPWFAVAAAILFSIGLYIGFFVAPVDAQQGEFYRIMFIHVPASILSMFLYLVMAGYAALGLIFNTRLSAMMASAIAPTGALFAFISLWTGALWGKPMWGAWWLWDARMTSELILLFLYLGFIALHASIDDPRRADRAAALLAIVGSVNVPIIYFSVQWWNTASGLDDQVQRNDNACGDAACLAGYDACVLVIFHRGCADEGSQHHTGAGTQFCMGN